ncbi:flagellar biosynthetic protein FliO [Opitutales bacterium]|nr:flagellar biosynthetic protein FliO [Opitutales bacterium]
MIFHHFVLGANFENNDIELFWLWVRVVAFIGVMGASAYFLSQFTKRKRKRLSSPSNGKIVIADTCALGNRQFLMIAQCGKEKHLLGVSSGSVNHLAKLESHSSEIGEISRQESDDENV